MPKKSNQVFTNFVYYVYDVILFLFGRHRWCILKSAKCFPEGLDIKFTK